MRFPWVLDTVTRFSSSIDVRPAEIFETPSSHRVRMPVVRAARSISSRDAFEAAREASSSVIASSW